MLGISGMKPAVSWGKGGGGKFDFLYPFKNQYCKPPAIIKGKETAKILIFFFIL